MDYGLRAVAGSHSEPSGARAWPRNGCPARGAGPGGPGGAPDSLGVPGMGHANAKEFSQAHWMGGLYIVYYESIKREPKIRGLVQGTNFVFLFSVKWWLWSGTSRSHSNISPAVVYVWPAC